MTMMLAQKFEPASFARLHPAHGQGNLGQLGDLGIGFWPGYPGERFIRFSPD